MNRSGNIATKIFASAATASAATGTVLFFGLGREAFLTGIAWGAVLGFSVPLLASVSFLKEGVQQQRSEVVRRYFLSSLYRIPIIGVLFAGIVFGLRVNSLGLVLGISIGLPSLPFALWMHVKKALGAEAPCSSAGGGRRS